MEEEILKSKILDKIDWFPAKEINSTQRLKVMEAMESYFQSRLKERLPSEEEIADAAVDFYDKTLNDSGIYPMKGFVLACQWFKNKLTSV